MTLDEARTIWLTLLGSDWVAFYDMMTNTHYMGTLDEAYCLLRDAKALDADYDGQRVKIKCY